MPIDSRRTAEGKNNLSRCAKCRKSVIVKHTCNVCSSSYHRSCAILYIKYKSNVVCCVRSLSHLLDSVPSPLADTAHLSDHSIPDSSVVFTFSPTQPSPLSTMPLHPDNTSQVPTLFPSTSLPPLPDDWNSLDLTQQLARVMQTCMSNGSLLSSMTASVQQNAATSARNTAEIQTLKELRACAQPSPVVVVAGIPASTTISHQDIVHRILARLNLSGLQTDILDIRKMNLKPAQNVNVNVNSTPASTALPKYDIFSIIVKFKSADIRNHVVDAKRRIGRITVAEICYDTVPATVQGTIYVNEFLPAPVYALYQKTKEKAREANYKRVWVRNGAIFVRKDEKSHQIPIVTELDLFKLI